MSQLILAVHDYEAAPRVLSGGHRESERPDPEFAERPAYQLDRPHSSLYRGSALYDNIDTSLSAYHRRIIAPGRRPFQQLICPSSPPKRIGPTRTTRAAITMWKRRLTRNNRGVLSSTAESPGTTSKMGPHTRCSSAKNWSIVSTWVGSPARLRRCAMRGATQSITAVPRRSRRRPGFSAMPQRGPVAVEQSRGRSVRRRCRWSTAAS